MIVDHYDLQKQAHKPIIKTNKELKIQNTWQFYDTYIIKGMSSKKTDILQSVWP